MARRVKRLIKYRAFPFMLSFILLFTYSLHSGLLSPSPAHAVAIADDIIIGGTIIAWLSAAGIAIDSTLASSDGTIESTITGLKDLCNQYSTFLNEANGYVWSQLISGINDISIFVDETLVKPIVSIDNALTGTVNNILSGFGDWIVDTFSISSNMNQSVPLYASTAYRLADGTPINIGINMSNAVMQFEIGTTYNTVNGYFFVNSIEDNGTYLYTYDVHNGGTLIYGDSSSASRYYDIYGFYLSGSIQFLLKSTISNYSRSANTNHSAQDLFGASTDSSIDGLGKDVLPELDLSNATDDDAVYLIPDNSITGSLPSNATLDDVAGAYLDAAKNGDLVLNPDNATSRVIAQEGTAPIEPEPDIPTYELPLIGINFPANWSLNLHGIWHYVRTWVSSIASFINWIFGVYSNLPYTMVVPIYATAVIVIVLGIYKRFFM